jgi:hypothetical protein
LVTWIPFLTTVIAAIVALVGYVVNQYIARREKKAQFYADALLAVKEFEEIPYRIAKRSDSTPGTRERLGNSVNDGFVKLSYYRAWLRIDSPLVAMAYDNLARKAARIGDKQQLHAWQRELITEDAEMNLGEIYYSSTRHELEVCVQVMRHELGFFAFLARKSTLAKIHSIPAVPGLEEGVDYIPAVQTENS